ncbi:MAG TPA: hypothetical protein VNE67_09040 [Acetobacteraceae bacterium]|nr:hypothetical protein [Acetobacteraceae bacterium]
MSGSASSPAQALAAGVQALAEALRAAANDPADQVRLLSVLAAFQAEPAPPAASPLAQARAEVSAATAAMCRRAALASLARACAAYRPSSYDDAATLLEQVAPLFDLEITTAADAGDLASYAALKTLRADVVADLTARGADLPRLVTLTFNAPMPAFALAYRLYRDASRAIDLMNRNDAPHPAFMPATIEALSS